MSREPTPTPPADWDRLAELFERIRAADPGLRAEILEALRVDAPAVAGEIEAMLDASPASAALELESRFSSGDVPASLAPGDRVGPWRIDRFLARGGMGEVYLAARADGVVEQRAAVKLLRPGIASPDLLDRFRLERSLLARLEHPGVAPLLDAGTAADGRPYLALRYVDGRPITHYCAETGASPERRAQLFVDLCRTVQFAHTHLVVHRDLKPSNVLVSDDGRVHLLDFGIAKLLGQRDGSEGLTEPTRALELAPMTPQRAAPEQRRGEPPTTATDVWALGILLYELFTGELPPHSSDALGGEVSAKTAGLDRDRASILSRALAREPGRRYASAGELAADVERWLAGEPVKARADSFAYRLSRFLGRHRLAATAATAAGLALAALAAISIVRSREATRERQSAADAAARSEAVVDMVVELFGGLDPVAGADIDTVRVADLIALGEARAERLANQPDVQARLRHVLGRIQLERSVWKPALALLRLARDAEVRRLAADDPAIVQLQLDYARALHSSGDRAGALAEARAARARAENPANPDPKLAIAARVTMGAFAEGEEGEALVRSGIAALRSSPDSDPLDLAAAVTALAWRRQLAGDKAEAREYFSEALEILRRERGESHPHTLGLRSNLASLLADPDERLAAHQAILALRRQKLGDRHYLVANSWSAIGKAHLDDGSFTAAAEAYEAARSIWEETAGEGHAMTKAAARNRDRARELEAAAR
uniref:Serine/threonine protein kinase n=1 Tax=uncultured bacterium A1Q1_fos_2037 TaxID=1256558 RepID=L7VTG1_9BACT|nr:serine/threonine protein kinase [uncultured bacterium A1Q1_fos_2037]